MQTILKTQVRTGEERRKYKRDVLFEIHLPKGQVMLIEINGNFWSQKHRCAKTTDRAKGDSITLLSSALTSLSDRFYLRVHSYQLSVTHAERLSLMILVKVPIMSL